MWHPWRRLRELDDIEVIWRDRLRDGDVGHCLHAHRVILMSRRQTQAERRCTITHELVHLERGPVAEHRREHEEVLVERESARLLIDIRKLGEALAWTSDLDQVAEELWVDVPMLQARLDGLHPAERGYLRERLAHLTD